MSTGLQGIRVVCFYPWIPFAPTGAWTRFTCLWKYLLQEGAQVTLAFIDQGNDAQLKNISVRYQGENSVINNVGAMARGLVAADAKSELRLYSAAELNFLLMYEKDIYLTNGKTGPFLDAVIENQDIVTCDYPMFAPLLSEFCRKWGKPLILTNPDTLFELHGSHPGAKERLRQKEIHALGLADVLVFCSEQDRLVFAEFGLSGTTILNTGDVRSITPGNEEQSRSEVRAKLKLKPSQYVLFVGSAHAPNQAAAAEIQRLAKMVPDIAFIVVGSCHEKKTEGNFQALGQVPEALLDTLYRGAFAVVVPLTHGTGASLKLFQALTYGKPVVATPVGARGYDVRDGQELLIVPSVAEVAAGLRRLSADPGLRATLAENARKYALQRDYRLHFKPYGDIIRQLTNQTTSTQVAECPALRLVDNNLSDRVGHHFNYALSLKTECALQRIPFGALIKQGASDDVGLELSGTGVFTRGIHEECGRNPFPAEWGNLRSTYDFLSSGDLFARELEAGLAENVCAGDLVFLPNATPRQILGLALLLVKNPIFLTLQYVLILRYSVNVAVGPIANRKSALDKESAERYASAIEKLQGADALGRVRLATDSAELAKEYGPFSKRPVEVLPIPHTSPLSQDCLLDGIPAKTPQKLRIVYLGDAREEKGFELLPAVIGALGSGIAGSTVEFVFQAFISSPYHYKMSQVIKEIERLKLASVHLIKGPLSSAAYQTLLDSSDLVLLPYDAVTYRARTSGPFVEAICANKPVVVPRSSWMSAQLGQSQAGVTFTSGDAQDLVRAVVAARTNIATHHMAAEELGKEFRQFHNPRNFVRQLMKITTVEAANPEGRVFTQHS